MDEMPRNANDELARLEEENSELRARQAKVTVDLTSVPRSTKTKAVRRLRLIGVLMIGGAVAVPPLVLTHLYPPWVRVKSEYQQALYWQTWQRDIERQFVGFDHVDSEAKKQKDRPATRSSGTVFEAIEYRIDWPLLWAERVVIFGLIAVGAYLAYNYRASRLGESE